MTPHVLGSILIIDDEPSMVRALARLLARDRVNAALVAAFTPICVEKFMTQPDATVKLTEFQKTSTWRQQEFVEKGGWATRPDSKEPNAKVAGACAGQLTQTNKT